MDGSVGDLDLSTRRPVPDPNPFGLLGWATPRLIVLDGMSPGLLARLLSAAPMSRQAIFAALARVSTDDLPLARVLRDGKARDIVEAASGVVPDGYLGALARIGGEPLPRTNYYLSLHDTFADVAKRPRARALRHCGRISKLTLDAIAVLEPKWLHPNILIHAADLREVVEFQSALRLLQSLPHGPNDDAVSHALSSMGPRSRLGSVIARLIRGSARFPDQPVSPDDDFEPLDNAVALTEISREFRNCLRHRIMGALVGQSAYAVFRRKAIAEFRRLGADAGWVLYNVHGPMNDHVAPDLRRAVQEACATRGLPYIARDADFEDWQPLVAMGERGGLFYG